MEFLYDPGSRSFAFLEVNTRLQVEHSITEATTGVDLVKAQIHVAGGGRLTDLYAARPAEAGHAVEARLNAEDPDRDFAPAPGRIVRLDLPAGPGVRVDTGVAEGDTIPPDFDSMIAKIIAVGRDRDEALARLRRAMSETTVVIEGGASNKSFVLDLLAQPEVVDGKGGWADTGWIDRVRAEGRLVAQAHAGVAVVAAAIEAYRDEVELEATHLLETAHGGRPQVQHQVGRRVEVKLRGTTYLVSTLNTGPSRYQVTVTGPGLSQSVEAELDWMDEFHRRLVVGGRRHRIVTATHGPTTLVEVDGVAHRVTRDEGGVLRSPAPALVVATPVGVGDEVEAGAPVIVLESMKMETVLHAPFAARIKELPVSTGSQVETGAPLVRLEQIGEDDAEAEVAQAGPAIELPAAPDTRPAADRLSRARSDLAAVVLGFDVSPTGEVDALSRYLTVREEVRAEGVPVLEDEFQLLGTFADLAELSRNRPADEERHTELRVHSSREHFHTYLQSLDVERGGLPPQFSDRLLRVLRHYGVQELERTPKLEEAVFRIFLAQQRSAPEVAIASALLGCWIAEPAPAGDLAAHARQVLERLGRATQLRFPVIGDLARSVRFRWFDQPQVDAEREDVLTGVRDQLTAAGCRRWPARPGRPDRLAGSHPRADREVPCREVGRGHPGPGADARGVGAASLPRVRPPRPAVDRGFVGGWGASLRGRRVHPRRPSDPPGLHDRHVRRPGRSGGRPDHGDRRPGDGSRGRARGRRRPLPALARGTRGCRGGQPGAASAGGRAAVRPARCAGSRSPCAPAPSGRSATTPSVPTARVGRSRTR